MRVLFLLILVTFGRLVAGQFSTDILGGNYQSRIIECVPDSEGVVVANLIKKPSKSSAYCAILYVHGYNDYFFQKHLGDSIDNMGFAFYAIDLRKYGRSYLSHQTRFGVNSLTEYHEELDSALNIISDEGFKDIILMGHSTGGLIVTHYYLNHQRNSAIKGLILNSPFFDFNVKLAIEKLGVSIISYEGKKHPDKEMSQSLNANYGESLHSEYKGSWEYDLKWKPIISPSVSLGWVRAIHLAQQEVHKSDFKIPVLLMSSDKSYKKERWSEDIHMMDAVLDVKDIARVGKKLGDNVVYKIIPGGKHDLCLSQVPARVQFFATVRNWLNENFIAR